MRDRCWQCFFASLDLKQLNRLEFDAEKQLLKAEKRIISKSFSGCSLDLLENFYYLRYADF
jgi:hypothetical protein